ncbi:MAG: hypothetical protein M3347_03075, partial [Armatimonadota bacterium]|nr:hypothetical protein [Armatimonadota bacterium]
MSLIQSAQSFHKRVNRYLPTIIGVTLLVLLSVAAWNNWVAQLSDVLNSNSAAEAPRTQFVWPPWGAKQDHVTWNWAVNFGWVVVTWLFLLYMMFRWNHAHVPHGTAPFVDALIESLDRRWGIGLRLLFRLWGLPLNDQVLANDQVLESDTGKMRQSYARLVLWTWLIGSLPPLWSIFALWFKFRTQNP